MREVSEERDLTLPNPKDLPYTPEMWAIICDVWMIWRATGKHFLPSQIIHEIQSGYKWALDGVMDMESFYGKLLEEVRPKEQ